MRSIYRLRKPWEFTKVIEKGKKVTNYEFVIFYSPSQLNNCQFGLGVPRKLVKKATRRNYYKRQIKNILVKYKSICRTLPSCHYNLVIIVRPGFLAVNHFSVKQNLLTELLNSIFQKEPKVDQLVNKEIFYA